MNCKKCGFVLDSNDKVCKNCNAHVEDDVKIQEIEEVIEILDDEEQSVLKPIPEPIIQENINIIESPLEEESPNKSTVIKNVKGKKNTNNNLIIKTIIILALCLIVIIAAMVLIKNNIAREKNNNKLNTNENITGTTVYRISYKGFDFSIPENLIYEEKSGSLLVADIRGSWVAQLEIQPGSYSKLKANQNNLPPVIKKYGYTVNEVVEKNLATEKYLTLQMSQNGSNMLLAFANIHPNYFLGITVLSQNQEFDYSILEKITPIVKSASYSDTNASIEFSSILNMSEFTQLAR